MYERETEVPLAALPAGVLPHALVKLRVADVKAMLELLTEMGLLTAALDAFLAQLPSSRTSLHYYALHSQSAFACAHCQHDATIADAAAAASGADQTSNASAPATPRNRTQLLAFGFFRGIVETQYSEQYVQFE